MHAVLPNGWAAGGVGYHEEKGFVAGIVGGASAPNCGITASAIAAKTAPTKSRVAFFLHDNTRQVWGPMRRTSGLVRRMFRIQPMRGTSISTMAISTTTIRRTTTTYGWYEADSPLALLM